jgi:hypothetical protein
METLETDDEGDNATDCDDVVLMPPSSFLEGSCTHTFRAES